MRKMELLSPAGNMLSLKQAAFNGADSVYLGIKKFNARNNIDGFTLESLKEAVEFAHLHNVKVFLAINILFKDEELLSAVNTIAYANNLGVDAFIIQDLGLCKIVHKLYPNIILHASTQLAIHNLEGAIEAQKLGFKRVVLSREVSLNEIKRIRQNSNIELEVFAHGALCVSFSGNCYMCSHLKNKSGNRGECLQFCRLKYKLFDNDKMVNDGYLLSAKDICTLNYLQKLQEVGVDCLKIEGRARREFYVAAATRVYSKALLNETISQSDLYDLNLAFNREFTPAYFEGNNNIISKMQGHNGVKIGKVKNFIKGKKFNEVFIETRYQLRPKSVLKFVDSKNNQTSISAMDVKKQGEVFRVTTTNGDIKINNNVNLLSDESYENELLSATKRVPLKIMINAIEGKELIIKAIINDTEYQYIGNILESAKSAPITLKDFIDSFNKNDMFEPEVFGDIGNVFMPKSMLNAIRREFYENFKYFLLNKYNNDNNIKIVATCDGLPQIKKVAKNVGNIIVIDSVSQIGKMGPEDIVVYDPQEYCLEDVKKVKEVAQTNEFYLSLPNYANEEDIEVLKNIANSLNIGVVANNLYALNLNCKIIGGGFLNVYNSYTINLLQEKGINVFYAKELTEGEMCDLKNKTGAQTLKDKRHYMTLRHCPIKHFVGGNCNNCKYKSGLSYKMEDGTCFSLKRKKVKSCTFYLED